MRPARVRPLAEVAPEIAARLLAAARRRAFTAWLDGHAAARVRLAPGFEHPGDPRPARQHAPALMSEHVLAVDIGGTKIAAAVVDRSGAVLRHGDPPTAATRVRRPAGGGARAGPRSGGRGRARAAPVRWTPSRARSAPSTSRRGATFRCARGSASWCRRCRSRSPGTGCAWRWASTGSAPGRGSTAMLGHGRVDRRRRRAGGGRAGVRRADRERRPRRSRGRGAGRRQVHLWRPRVRGNRCQRAESGPVGRRQRVVTVRRRARGSRIRGRRERRVGDRAGGGRGRRASGRRAAFRRGGRAIGLGIVATAAVCDLELAVLGGGVAQAGDAAAGAGSAGGGRRTRGCRTWRTCASCRRRWAPRRGWPAPRRWHSTRSEPYT